MVRGKYAVRTESRREAELSEEVQSLTRQLRDHRALSATRERDHKRQMMTVRAEVSAQTAKMVQDYVAGKIATIVEGVSAATWKAQKVATTQHLAWLFFSGLLDWDRSRGDAEVLSFIAIHGDINLWFLLTEKYGFRGSRKDVRDAERFARQGMGFQNLLLMEKDILKTLDPETSVSERVRLGRDELNDIVDKAREAFMDVEMGDLVTEIGVMKVEATEEQKQIHSEVMEFIADYLAHAPGRT